MTKIDNLAVSGKIDKKSLVRFIEENADNIEHNFRDYSVILQASLNGLIFGVPQSPHTQYFAHRSACISENDYKTWKEDQDYAIDYLLTNYFHHYGPATLADFCHWSGLSQKDCRVPFERIKDKLMSLVCEGKTYYLFSEDKGLLEQSYPVKFVKLLGKFDPLFVSFSDKTWIATPVQQKAIWRPAAHIEAVLLVNEKLKGTWRYSIKGHSIDFTFYLFSPVTDGDKKKIDKEAQRIAAFLSKTINKIMYE